MTRHWPRILLRQAARHARHHTLLAGMNVLSIALGVCVFLAIMIANRSADRSFRAGVELVAGKAHLEVRGPLDETFLSPIAAVPGVAAATPVVQGLLTLRDHPGEYLRVLGIDPFTNPPFETFRMVQPDGAEVDVETWLRERDAIAITRAMAARLGLKPGDLLRVVVGGRGAELKARFVLEPDDPAALADIRTASMDIAWAQELLGTAGKLDSVQILVEEGADSAAVADAIRRIVPRDAAVAAPKQRSRSARAFSRRSAPLRAARHRARHRRRLSSGRISFRRGEPDGQFALRFGQHRKTFRRTAANCRRGGRRSRRGARRRLGSVR